MLSKEDYLDEYEYYLTQKNEIGMLSSSVFKLSDDLDHYIRDIKS